MTMAASEHLRITLTAGIFPPDAGGPATYVSTLARELVGRGHRVRVVCTGDQPGRRHVDAFPVARIRRAAPVPVRVARTIGALARAARDADVIFANGLELEAAVAGRLLGKPVVQKVVGDYAWERARNRAWFAGTIEEYQTARKKPFLRVLDGLRALPIRAADRVLVPSRYLAGVVAGWGVSRDRIDVVANATLRCEPSAGTRSRPAGQAPVILMVNRLVAWKHVDRVIRLLPELPEARLVILGDGPLESTLRALATSVGVEHRVSFAGRVDAEAVARWMKTADVFLLNSSYEGLPHVVLEAMAAGMPVVATSAGGTGEVVEHDRTGLLVPPADDGHLLAALRRLLADPALAERLGREARHVVGERFGVEQMIQRTEAVLRGVCAPWVGGAQWSMQSGGG